MGTITGSITISDVSDGATGPQGPQGVSTFGPPMRYNFETAEFPAGVGNAYHSGTTLRLTLLDEDSVERGLQFESLVEGDYIKIGDDFHEVDTIDVAARITITTKTAFDPTLSGEYIVRLSAVANGQSSIPNSSYSAVYGRASSSATTPPAGNYIIRDNNGDPITTSFGVAWSSIEEIDINYTDADGTDQETELQDIIAGSVFTIYKSSTTWGVYRVVTADYSNSDFVNLEISLEASDGTFNIFGSTRIDWNPRGAQGPQGPQGEPGISAYGPVMDYTFQTTDTTPDADGEAYATNSMSVRLYNNDANGAIRRQSLLALQPNDFMRIGTDAHVVQSVDGSNASFVEVTLDSNITVTGAQEIRITAIADGIDGTDGATGDSYKIVYLFQNSSTGAPTGPAFNEGFTLAGEATNANPWFVTATAPALGETIYVAEITIRQPASTGSWFSTLSSGTWPVNIAGTAGQQGETGPTGSAGPRFASRRLFATIPSTHTGSVVAPSATITWATLAIGSIVDNDSNNAVTWTTTEPTLQPAATDTFYYTDIVFIDTTGTAATTTATGSTPQETVNFTGVVTFSSGDFSIKDGSNVTNITTINGGNISTGTISADKLTVGDIDLIYEFDYTVELSENNPTASGELVILEGSTDVSEVGDDWTTVQFIRIYETSNPDSGGSTRNCRPAFDRMNDQSKVGISVSDTQYVYFNLTDSTYNSTDNYYELEIDSIISSDGAVPADGTAIQVIVAPNTGESLISGDIIVEGSVTANKILTENLAAISSRLGKVVISDVLDVSGASTGIVAGRTGATDFLTDGFAFLREQRGSISLNVQSLVYNPTTDVFTMDTNSSLTTNGEYRFVYNPDGLSNDFDFNIRSINITDNGTNWTWSGNDIDVVKGEIPIDLTVFQTSDLTFEAAVVGFELSSTNVPADNRLSGFIHSEVNGLEIWNPRFRQGAVSSGATTVVTSNQTVTLTPGTEEGSVTVSVIGGGGGGGAGVDDHGGSGFAASGGSSSVSVYHTSVSASNLIDTITSNGGAGGCNGCISRLDSNGNGQSSIYGSGGNGGGNQGAGANATGYGAGGGGGGGDAPGLFDNSGNRGLGGSASTEVSQTIDVSSYSGNIILVYTLGAGGAGSTGGNYFGGAGSPGRGSYSSIYSGIDAYDLDDLINSGASDEHLKENIVEIPDALEKVNSLTGYSYDYKTDDDYKNIVPKQRHDVGLLVGDVEEVLPQAIISKKSHKRIRYAQLVPLLVNAINELEERVIDLESKINKE